VGLDVTVIVAQIINFAVLVWLLNRVLYRPITNLMRAREERLRRDMERAEALAEEARQAEQAFRERAAQLERERGWLLEEAREAARRERDRLLRETAEEAQEARRQFAESLAAERREIQKAVEANLVRHVTETSARIIGELSGMPVADAIIATLESRWEEQAAEALPGLPAVDGGRVVVRTSFVPTDRQRERLAALARRLHPQAAVGGQDAAGPSLEDIAQGPRGGEAHSEPASEQAGEPVSGPAIDFVVDSDLVLGVEIEGGGIAIGWTARDMLDEMRRDALAALDEAGRRTGAGTGTDAEKQAAGEGEVKAGA